jgi:hypothetical protein
MINDYLLKEINYFFNNKFINYILNIIIKNNLIQLINSQQ